MLWDQQVQAQRQALQGQFDILSETLKRLREKYATETDVPEKVKLERQIKETENALKELSQEMDALERAPTSARPIGAAGAIPIPPLLPYLSDRSAQEAELGQALHLLQKNQSRRPFICIVHGDEFECHDMFLDRLLRDMLPNLLHPDTTFKDFLMPWPEGVIKQDPAKIVRKYLANALVGNSAASTEEMFAEISRHEMVMVHTHLMTKNWEGAAPELAKEFMVLWSRWPDHAPGHRLIICVFVKYQRPERQGFLQRRKIKSLNEEIRRFLTELDFSSYDQLHGVVLPELCAISRSEVEDWVFKHTREFCRIDALLPKIRALYEQKELSTPKGCIAMEILAEKLKILLNEYRC